MRIQTQTGKGGGALHLGFRGGHLLIAGAGVGALPEAVAPADHLQTPPLLVLFVLGGGELGFDLDRVDVGVEVGHDGEDEGHHHQQAGEQDVLGPLAEHTHTPGQTLRGLGMSLLLLLTGSTYLLPQRSGLSHDQHDDVADGDG